MSDEPHRSPVRDVAAVAAVALVLRVAWVGYAHHAPGGLSDPLLYWRFALDIAHGHGYVSFHGNPTAYYPPGYPYFLGALQWVCDGIGLRDHLPLVAGLVQSVLGAVAAGATVLAGRTLGSRVGGGRTARWTGLAAGLVVAVWPNLIVYSSTFLSETLFVAVFAVFVASVLRLHTPDGSLRRGWTALAAASLGLSTLVRPQVLVVVPALAVAWLVGRRGLRVVARDLALIAAGVVIALTPWVIRNEIVLHAFVALSDNGGDNLCVGFHPGATGHFEVPPSCDTGEFYTDGPKAELRRDAETQRRAVRWATHHLGALPALSARKLWYTYDTDTDGLRAVESYEADRFLPSTVRTAIHGVADGAYVVIMAAAAAGAVALVIAGRRRRTDGTISAVLLMTLLSGAVPVAFFGDARFKVPTTPLFALLAGVAIAAAAEAVLRRRQPDDESRPIETS